LLFARVNLRGGGAGAQDGAYRLGSDGQGWYLSRGRLGELIDRLKPLCRQGKMLQTTR
jgi:hypothetical protein